MNYAIYIIESQNIEYKTEELQNTEYKNVELKNELYNYMYKMYEKKNTFNQINKKRKVIFY